MDTLQSLLTFLPLTCEAITVCSVINTIFIVVLIRILYCVCLCVVRNIRIRKTRNRKVDQTTTTKGKLLQKLIGLKTPMENRNTLTNLTFDEVRNRILNKDYECIDVLEAYQARALEIDSKFNCVAEVVYDADVTALYLDSLSDDMRGRLHGIPLSVQESVKQTDYDSYFGSVSRCFNPEKNTAPVIEALCEEGMIPFVRTTGGQTDLSIDCTSYLFGETLNPRDTNRVCGGSGGVGAIIAAKGSLAGVGVDIFGGLRISASFCGTFGFKPTHDRVGRGQVGTSNILHRPGGCGVTVGPMSSDLDLLVEMMKITFSDSFFNINGQIPRLNFNQECFDDDKPMTIGYYKAFSDNSLSVCPVPAVERTIEEVRNALEKRGHTLVEWEPPRISYASKLFIQSLYTDCGEASCQLSKVDKVQNMFHWMAGFGCFTKFFSTALLALKNPVLSEYLKASGRVTYAHQALRLIDEISEYREVCDRSWNDAKLDALICPVLPFASPSTGSSNNALPGILYSCIYNFLNYPAGVVPVSEVTQADVEKLRTANTVNMTADLLQSQINSVGQSLGVQCVSCSFEDEKVLRLMKEIQLSMNL